MCRARRRRRLMAPASAPTSPPARRCSKTTGITARLGLDGPPAASPRARRRCGPPPPAPRGPKRGRRGTSHIRFPSPVPLARQDGHGQPASRPPVAACEPVARDERDMGLAAAGAGALGIGDARDIERRRLRFQGAADKVFRSRAGVVIEVEFRPILCQKRRLRQPGMGGLRARPAPWRPPARPARTPFPAAGRRWRRSPGGARPARAARSCAARSAPCARSCRAVPAASSERLSISTRVGLVGAPGAGFAHKVAQEVQNIVCHGGPNIARISHRGHGLRRVQAFDPQGAGRKA